MSGETPESGTGADAPRSAGEQLRAAREAQGLRVDTAAETLGFARDIVIALEADDYARLGVPVYVRGYLRKYAHYLGLSGDEVVARYERGAAPHEPELTAHWGSIAAPRRAGGRRWLVAVVTILVAAILVIAALWGWRYVRQQRENPQIPPAAAASAAQAFSGDPAERGFANLPPPATRGAAGLGSSASNAASSSAAAAPVTTAAVVPGHPQLALHLTAVSWIEVRAADRTRLYYDLAPAGETLHFDDKHGALTVYLGNAAGVQVEVNGRQYRIPAAGRKGDTARFTVILAPGESSAAAPTR